MFSKENKHSVITITALKRSHDHLLVGQEELIFSLLPSFFPRFFPLLHLVVSARHTLSSPLILILLLLSLCLRPSHPKSSLSICAFQITAHYVYTHTHTHARSHTHTVLALSRAHRYGTMSSRTLCLSFCPVFI